MSVNERVRAIRVALKLTQVEFGRILTIAQTYLSQIEKGDRDVTEKILKLICFEFNVNEEWLRNGKGEMFIQDKWDNFANIKGLDKQEAAFLKAYMSMDKDVRQNAINQFMKFYNQFFNEEAATTFEEEKTRKLREYEQELNHEKSIETSSASPKEKGTA